MSRELAVKKFELRTFELSKIRNKNPNFKIQQKKLKSAV